MLLYIFLFVFRLYHQITVKIEEYVTLPQVQANEELRQFYNKFIKDFEIKLNPLSLVKICVTISKTFKGVEPLMTTLT
jgi:26S proteasome regulatory subunit N9